MIRKLVAIFISVLINCAILGWIGSWNTATVADVTPSLHADGIPTLPTITVYPTRAQLELLRGEAAPASTSAVVPGGVGAVQTLVMPFYSFGGGVAGVARNG